MKKIYFTLIALMYILPIYSQLFEKIESGDIVADFSDSRSVNFVDVNNDGWEDIFISNGINPGVENLFYLNNGAGNYSKVTSGDIVGHPAPFDGATFADIDNDGNLDAFAVTWYGIKNYLYYGNGDGTFNYDSGAAPSMGTTYSETASWGDMDNDGDLDLYVTNSTNLNGTSLKNDLYKNNGDGSFTKINGGVAVIQAHPSRSVNWTDYDNDGDLDLFVSNESNRPDDLYRNDGNGNFSVAPNAPSQSIRSTMSSSWGDIDNDGDLDLFVANSGFYSEQKNQLFKNNGDGTFSEITSGPAADFGCSYGSNFGDYDNDGDLDLVVANGFCNGSIFNFLYLNDGQGNFSRDMASSDDLSTPCSYGVAWGDINNDGFLDLGFATCKNKSGSPLAKNIFYRNIGNDNNWVKIKPIGTESNRSGIGAKVRVTAVINGVSVTQMREISAQSGYCGQNSLYAHFGLGNATEIEEVKVTFLGGTDITLTNVSINSLINVAEDMSTAIDEPLKNNVPKINITPNPASDMFTINMENITAKQKLQLSIVDTFGRVNWNVELAPNGNTIWEKTLSAKELGMASGHYFLKIEGEGFVENLPFAVY